MQIIKRPDTTASLRITRQEWLRIGQGAGWRPRTASYGIESGQADIEVERYGNRNWAVYVNGELLCVCLYRKGAQAVAKLVEEMAGRIQEVETGEELRRTASLTTTPLDKALAENLFNIEADEMEDGSYLLTLDGNILGVVGDKLSAASVVAMLESLWEMIVELAE